MQNYRVMWKSNGEPQRSGGAYDLASAENRTACLEQEAGVTDVGNVPEKPGV
ncbi:hypothetical protein ABTX77_40435 [Streptomyces sp. NPDC097704]|uniref:hypothetical protein n=1 Tax=Streptomyces sp. NPDC097704 TaxID=3157101 RepID=UPI003326C2B9